jgi:DeoR/GlpR family transcriptional regulator of sugar metabolism
LSELFQVSVPTIRKALRIAVKADPSLKSLLQKLSRLRWEDQHYQEVAELHQQGLSLGELCRHFGRSEPLIRAALRLAEQNPQVVDTGNHEGNPPPTSSTSNT